MPPRDSENRPPLTEATSLKIILQARNRRGQFSACLPDGTILVRSSRQPFLDAARTLLDSGYPATTWIEGCRPGAATFALRARLGAAAGLTVNETKISFARWKAFSWSAVDARSDYYEGPGTGGAHHASTA